jgi:hypothetical protein
LSRVNYLTVAQNFALETACAVLNDAGCGAYLVGSCMERGDYRDVDLRCILDDDEFEKRFGGQRVRLRLFNAAISEWVTARTGLPIDFQFQSRTEAEQYKGRPRNPMGILIQCESAADKRAAITKAQAECQHDGEYTDHGDSFTCDDCGALLKKDAA